MDIVPVLSIKPPVELDLDSSRELCIVDYGDRGAKRGKKKKKGLWKRAREQRER